MRSSHALDRIGTTFDDDHAVANAGLVLTATLGARLGLEGARRRHGRPRAASRGGPSRTQGHDARPLDGRRWGLHRRRRGAALRSLRAGARPSGDGALDARDVPALVHLRPCPPARRVAEGVLRRAWAAGAGPGDESMTIDIDSTICEVHGHHKQGAAFGYTKRARLSPAAGHPGRHRRGPARALRKGSANTARGARAVRRELIARVRRAGATGALPLRADSGFWSNKVIKACRDHGCRYSITVRQVNAVKTAIAAIDDDAVDRRSTTPGRRGRRWPSAPTATGIVSWCDAPGSSAPRPSCSPTGVTTRSSPTPR